jgi:ectoine hydroxylase-related dioxygenase (phytanoyl-CoA dioxygenase family)
MEINVWMPLTECLAENGLIYADLDESLHIWREYDFDFRRFHIDLDERDDLQARCASISKPYLCDYGELLLFDSRCMHLSQRNRTNQTRISIDFRVVPISDAAGLSAGYVGTGRRRARFEPGGYYARKTTAQL